MSIQYYAPSHDMAEKFLESFTRNRDKLPPDFFMELRVFAIGEKKIIRAYKGKISLYETRIDYGYAKIDKLDRGAILSAFAKLEFLINESINLFFLNAKSEKNKNLSFLVKKLPFRQRIEAIKEFEIINSSTEKKLKKLSSTRNILAHEWHEESAMYDRGYLEDAETLKKFDIALASIYEIIITKHKELQESSGYSEYLDILINKMESYS